MTFPPPFPPPEHPEIPFPFPGRPTRTEPVPVPIVDLPSGDVHERLFERRQLLVDGTLEHDAVTRLCAELMALDGRSNDPVELIVNSEGGPLAAISAVLDVLDLMRAPVRTTCVGMAKGTAGVLVACGTGERRIAAHARLLLRCDHVESVDGSASDIIRRADEITATRHRLEQALATATGQPADVVAAELERGTVHDADEAVALGLVDGIIASGPVAVR